MQPKETRAERRERIQEERKFARIIRRLGSSDAGKRFLAEREIWEIGPAAVEKLIAGLEEQARAYRRLPLTMVVMAALSGLGVALVDVISGHSPSFPGMFGGVWGPATIMLSTYHQQRNSISRVLAKFDDVRAVGFLAEALEFRDKHTRQAAAEALIRLLPRLKASDAHLLNAKQRAILLRTFNRPASSAALIVAILKAYEQVGDESALEPVRSLLTALNPRVQEAATECLPFLESRIAQQRASQTLLRASSPIETATPDMLLRPALESGETNPQELLRATTDFHPKTEPTILQENVHAQ